MGATAKRVLIADDSAIIRRQFCRIIESDSRLKVVAEAVNGLEAVQKAKECRPDLVVLDFQMPVMNGLQATREIKKREPSMPVLMVTLYDTGQMEREVKRAGGDAFLLKTDVAAHLSGVIHSLLPPDQPADNPAQDNPGLD